MSSQPVKKLPFTKDQFRQMLNSRLTQPAGGNVLEQLRQSFRKPKV